jgi:hypothetical protein
MWNDIAADSQAAWTRHMARAASQEAATRT